MTSATANEARDLEAALMHDLSAVLSDPSIVAPRQERGWRGLLAERRGAVSIACALALVGVAIGSSLLTQAGHRPDTAFIHGEVTQDRPASPIASLPTMAPELPTPAVSSPMQRVASVIASRRYPPARPVAGKYHPRIGTRPSPTSRLEGDAALYDGTVDTVVVPDMHRTEIAIARPIVPVAGPPASVGGEMASSITTSQAHAVDKPVLLMPRSRERQATARRDAADALAALRRQ